MALETKLIEEGPRRVIVKLEIDGTQPEMGLWQILDRFKTITEGAYKADIARAMTHFTGREVNRQMVDRWFRPNNRLTPRVDYFLALVAVLTGHFKQITRPDPEPIEKRPPGRPRIHPIDTKPARPRGRPRKNQ